jgi:phosphoenolpyruvate-protein phosphotransferase
VRLLDLTRASSGRERVEVEQIADERQRLQAAIVAAEDELDKLYAQVARTVGQAEAEIFLAQKLMVRDPELLDEVEELMVRRLFAADTAWSQVVKRQSAELAELGDATLAARAADVRDMGDRVLNHLQSKTSSENAARAQQEPALLVAYDLTPSQTAELNPASILGICTVEGGPTTHAAIIARALEIPAVAGLDARVLSSVQACQEMAIDGGRGLIYLQPEGAQRERLREAMETEQRDRREKRAQTDVRWRTRPGETADGQAVLVYANVGDAEGAREAGERGAHGIGLLRTEFLFGQRETFPNEQEQLEGYIAVFRAFAAQALFRKTIVARTLDAGADKPFPALEPLLGIWQEANPALGLRGARIHLLREELLRQQLRALLRAAEETSIHLQIMFPMIATLEETRRLKQILAEVREELAGEGARGPQDLRVGIMIETPSAVWMADALAREVDFFSIGANDLFQYTLAADRTNSRVMGLFGELEPALWRSIDHVVQVARARKRVVAVCGEIAADPRIGPLLAGLGVEEVSVSPPALTRMKEALNQRGMAYWRPKAQALLRAETVAEIAALMADL